MNKEEYVTKYGEAAYEKKQEQIRKWHEEHPEEVKARAKKYYEANREEDNARSKKYREEHPEKIIANNQEQNRKGGKRYDKALKGQQTGLRGERSRIRNKHNKQYKQYKAIIAPDSQLHHEWVPTTADYRGVALVEADVHMHGFVDVIEILDGKITVLTEGEVKRKQIKKIS